jgi:hypothetical protein
MLSLFLILGLGGDEWTASHPRQLTLGKETWYPLDRRLVSPKTDLDAIEQRKSLASAGK